MSHGVPPVGRPFCPKKRTVQIYRGRNEDETKLETHTHLEAAGFRPADRCNAGHHAAHHGFAALWENGRIHNQEILTALENLCGSKDEAQHYYALLDEYGLLDEDGGLFSNWSGVITIQEKSRP